MEWSQSQLGHKTRVSWRALEPAEKALESSGRVSDISKRALEPAGRALLPADRALESARKGSEPVERPGATWEGQLRGPKGVGRKEKGLRMKRFWYVIIPYGAAAQKKKNKKKKKKKKKAKKTNITINGINSKKCVFFYNYF